MYLAIPFHILIPVIRSISQSSQRFQLTPAPVSYYETPGSLLAHTSAFAFGLFSPRSCACSPPRRTGWSIVAPPPLRHSLQLPREFEPAQRASSTHPTAPGAELYFGTGVVDTWGQIDVGQGASTHVQYQQQATLVYPEYSFVGDSTCVSDSAQLHRYYQHKPAPAPAHAAPLLSLESYTDVEIPGSRYFRLGARQWTQTTVRRTQRT